MSYYQTDNRQRYNIDRFYQQVEMPGGYSFNHVDTLRFIDLYYNSQFATGPTDSRGFRKFFFNIVVDKCDIARKFVDLDTKDIILQSEHADDEHRVWYLQRELKQYLKETKFSQLLNRITFNYPKYGHVILKKAGDKWHVANIHNFRFDPSSESLETDDFFYEVHLMTAQEINRQNWDKKAVKELLSRGYDDLYTIYECYDRTEEGWKRTVKGDLFTLRSNNGLSRALETQVNRREEDYVASVVLYEDEADPNDFYRELKWEEVVGRRLGKGFVEQLFDNQMAENEAENLERKGLYYKALQLWQTRDQGVGKNFLTDAENGDVLTVDSEVTPVQKENSDLAAFNNTRERWRGNSEQKTFAFDISRGENLPSRTPLGVANLSAAQVASYFEYKRENFGEFIRYLVMEDILPNLKKKSRKEHILTILGSDPEINKLDRAITDHLISQSIFNFVIKNGLLPDEAEREQEKQRVMQEVKKRKNRYIVIPDNFYDNVKYVVDVVVTGEQIDVATKQATLTVGMQIIGSNPQILQNRVTRGIFSKLMELGGVNVVDLGILNEEAEQEGNIPAALLGQGGSAAGPTAPAGGVAGLPPQ